MGRIYWMNKMDDRDLQHAELTQQVIGCAYTVHNALGAGFLESVYANAFFLELVASELKVIAQAKMDVYYRGRVVGHFFADLIVNELIILELKAVEELAHAHEVQLVNYLAASGKELGLLINFGPREVTVRRKVRDLSTLPPRTT